MSFGRFLWDLETARSRISFPLNATPDLRSKNPLMGRDDLRPVTGVRRREKLCINGNF